MGFFFFFGSFFCLLFIFFYIHAYYFNRRVPSFFWFLLHVLFFSVFFYSFCITLWYFSTSLLLPPFEAWFSLFTSPFLHFWYLCLPLSSFFSSLLYLLPFLSTLLPSPFLLFVCVSVTLYPWRSDLFCLAVLDKHSNSVFWVLLDWILNIFSVIFYDSSPCQLPSDCN